VQSTETTWTIVIHGGAGAMQLMSSARERSYRRALAAALRAGAAPLAGGGEALAAVIAAVRSMEDSAVFNAGPGSCLDRRGEIEADAAVMLGSDLSIGAVGAVPGVGNAVELAEAVRRHSPHCMLSGSGALAFARELGLELAPAPPSPERLKQYCRRLAAEGGDAQPPGADSLTRLGGTHETGDTVGAVARDRAGRLAVATSTGGLWLKQPGRVGDSPIPGAGFWAEDGLVACTATGTGEFIMRAALCHALRERVAAGEPLRKAAAGALRRLSERFGPGKAGLIAVDAAGNLAWPFDTEGMGRAALWSGAEGPVVEVWPVDRERLLGGGRE